MTQFVKVGEGRGGGVPVRCQMIGVKMISNGECKRKQPFSVLRLLWKILKTNCVSVITSI
jgi:hypothetical protein